MDFADLANLVGEGDNMGGLQTRILVGRWDDVAEFPDLPDLATATFSDGGVVDCSTLAMTTGNMMYEIYVTPDTAELSFEEQGDLDGKSFMGKLSFFRPGLRAEDLAFLRVSNNANLFFLIPDNNGFHYLLGNKQIPAKRAGGTGTTGKATGDRKGMEITFQAASRCPMMATITQADIDRLTTAAA